MQYDCRRFGLKSRCGLSVAAGMPPSCEREAETRGNKGLVTFLLVEQDMSLDPVYQTGTALSGASSVFIKLFCLFPQMCSSIPVNRL